VTLDPSRPRLLGAGPGGATQPAPAPHPSGLRSSDLSTGSTQTAAG